MKFTLNVVMRARSPLSVGPTASRAWLSRLAGLSTLGTVWLAGCAAIPPDTTASKATPTATATAAAPNAATPSTASMSAAAAKPPAAAVTAGAAPTTAAAPAGAAPTPTPPGGAAGLPPGAARPDPTALRPFAEVSRDAKASEGFFPLWRKDERVWIEIPRDRLGQPFLMTFNFSNSLGERGLYASQMGRSLMVRWERVGNQVQLIALNNQFRATGGGAAATAQAFSPSLLAYGAAASADHPQRKSFLVDAAMLIGDLPGLSTRLEAAFRLPYAPDRANSYVESTRADKTVSVITVRMHYATARIPAPPPPMATPSPIPAPTPPQTTPDPRSMFFSVVYNFRALPETPMAIRKADPRVGHFTTSYTDLSDDLRPNPKTHMVNRWRLEKKDPAAALSEPVQPIVYWLDKNIPPKYRKSVEAGILEWNKAFERIGFKNAIVARQQPDDASWDNMDATHASVRWFVGSDVGFAIGPSHTDPRTGEILDADIGMSDVFGRGARRLVVEDMTASGGTPDFAQRVHLHDAGAQVCSYADHAAQEMSFALDLLAARGDIEPDSPQADAFVQAQIKDTIMHEVGHTLGFKHNFRASTTVTRAQLRDPEFTRTRGISGSVMDYNAYNLSLPGETVGAPNNTTLGAYDYWAVEYAYKPITASNEAAELARIAARSTEPALSFADDADAGGFGPNEGLDPYVNRFDLGDDPLAYYQRRMALSKELWVRVQSRTPKAGEDSQRQRRSLLSGFRQLRDLPSLAAKFVGGMHTERDLPGTTGRPNFRPVDPAKQREALKFLSQEVLSVDSFRFRPEFLASLAPDYIEWDRSGPVSIPALVLQLQTQALDRLMSAGTASRLLDLPLLTPAAQSKGLISLSEVYGTLQSAVWSELSSGKEIERMRRNLQREHLKRLQTLLTRGSPTLPPDALSLARFHAQKLQAELQGAVKTGKGSVEMQAHLRDSLGTLTEALRATMQRM